MSEETAPPANFKLEIGRRIAMRRREIGLTQKALGLGAGLTRDFVAQVEIGRLEVNAGDMPRLCVALDVPISYFFSGLVKSPTDDPVLEGIRKLSAVAQGELTSQEAALLRNYRMLADEARASIGIVIHELALVRRLIGTAGQVGYLEYVDPDGAVIMERELAQEAEADRRAIVGVGRT